MTRITLYLAILTLIIGVPTAHIYAQTDADPTVHDMVYLVVFEPGPAWVKGKPVEEQNLRNHGRYLMNRYAEGQLLQAGPFTDDTGGAIIYRAENLAAAKELIAKDPAVVSGKFVATISPWRLVEWEYHQDRATLRKLNAQYIENFINKDVEAQEKILHPNFVYINGDGTISNRVDYMEKYATAYTDGVYTSFSISDVDIRLFGDMALVRSKIVHTKEENRETVHENSLHTDTYIKENGKWLCIQAHITPIIAK